MNVGVIARVVGQAVSARGSYRAFSKAREDHDKLEMLNALIGVASVAITVAILVREIRQNRAEGPSRVIDLEDN